MKKPQDNLLLALGFGALNALMLAAMSLCAKLLSEFFGPIESTFWRNSTSLIMLLIWLVFLKQTGIFKTKRPWAHLIRGIIGTAGIAFGMWTVSVLSLAQTTVLLFTSPLFTVLLSAPLLGERIGLHRYIAVFIGFLGVAIVGGPVGALPLVGLITGLCWGLCSGLVDICLRWMGNTEKSSTTVFYFLLFGTITTGLYWPFSQTPITSINTIDITHVTAIIAALGLTGGISLLAKTQSYRLGEASLVAPVMYTMLIWSIVFDYIMWKNIPTWSTITGAAMIVTANLFIIHREHKTNKKKTATEALEPPP